MKDVNILTNNGVNVQQGLELFGDMEMYDETLADFLTMVADKVNHLESTKTSDMPNYAIEVHSLKSDARYLGFTTLADLAYQSEMKSKANDTNFVLENHPKIVAETKRIISLAQQYLGQEVVDLIPNVSSDQQSPSEIKTESQPVQNVPNSNIQPINPQNQVQESAPQLNNIYAQSDNNQIEFISEPAQNDVMSQALYMQQQEQDINTDIPAVKKGIILVIDDSNLVGNFVKKIFNKEYDVITASDGNKGIELMTNPDISPKVRACLVDLNMPVVNGFQVMDYFYANGIFVKTPVAVISGVEEPEVLEKASNYPVIEVLNKPFNERDIQRVVERCLAAYF